MLGLYSMFECNLCCEILLLHAGHGRYELSFMWKTVERAMLSVVFI